MHPREMNHKCLLRCELVCFNIRIHFATWFLEGGFTDLLLTSSILKNNDSNMVHCQYDIHFCFPHNVFVMRNPRTVHKSINLRSDVLLSKFVLTQYLQIRQSFFFTVAKMWIDLRDKIDASLVRSLPFTAY